MRRKKRRRAGEPVNKILSQIETALYKLKRKVTGKSKPDMSKLFEKEFGKR